MSRLIVTGLDRDRNGLFLSGSHEYAVQRIETAYSKDILKIYSAGLSLASLNWFDWLGSAGSAIVILS